MQEIDAITLHSWLDTGRAYVLVDTLPDTAFAKAHLRKAVNIRSDDILDQAEEMLPDKTRAVVVYCASETCKRAPRSAKRLLDLGYSSVYEFTGGKKAWRKAGFPLVEKPES